MSVPPSPSPIAPSVCAVVVTFHPEPATVTYLAALRPQVAKIIVVDNGSPPAARARLEQAGAGDALEFIWNAENRGIAAALNQGVDRALAAGYDWIATFDQDSAAPAGYVTGLLAALERSSEPGRVAVLAPLYRDRHLGFLSSPSEPLTGDLTADVPVSVTATSGNLVSAAALRACGGFREDYFIDCVDFEFCLRCRRAGWQILEVRSVVLEHAAGRYQQRRWLWKNPRFNDYNAARRYYQARNRMFLYRDHAVFDPRWILRDAWGYGCDVIKLLLFCTGRREKIRALLAGLRDGLDGRGGPWRGGAKP